MADSTSGNSEELKLKITPELDQAALKKAQEELDKLKAKPFDGGKPSGGDTSTRDTKARTDALKQEIATIRQKKDIEDANLRRTRTSSNEKIRLLREQASVGKITMSEMNQQVISNQNTIDNATRDAVANYDKQLIKIDQLKQKYAGLEPQLARIAKAELSVVLARERAVQGFDSMSGSMARIESQTKLSSLAFMNFGRIVQDAPFGLIGISNNIDPLLMSLSMLSNEIDKSTGKVRGFGGSFKALAGQLFGPAGLIFLLGSALPSALLVLQRYQQNQSKDTNKAIEGTVSYVEKLFDLKTKVDLASKGFIDKQSVLKEYNETLGKSIGIADSINQASDLLAKKTPDYVRAMFLRTQAQLLLNQAAEEYLKIISGEAEQLSFRERMAFAGTEAGEQAAALRSARKKQEVIDKSNDLVEKSNKLYKESNELVQFAGSAEEEKLKYIDKTIVEQTKLRILSDDALFSANNENKTWEERLKLTEQGVFYLKTAQELELKSLQDQRSQTKELGEQLKLDSEILLKKQDMAKTDQILLDFQKKMSDARFDEMIQREQMIKQLEDEAAKFELIDVDLDLGGDFLGNRLKDAEEFINSVYDTEIQKAIDSGNKLKALFLERKQYEDKLTQHYMNLHYSREEARAMAQSETDIKFADKTEKTKLEVQTETFQAIGELASASLSMLFGESKNAQVAQVVIDTIMGIQKIWSQAGINPVVGALGSAALAAKGMAAISKIKSTTTKSSSISSSSSGSTTRDVMIQGVGSNMGQLISPNGTIMSASAQPQNMMNIPDISINANVDRRGLAIAVREGEQEIRTQQFSYT